MPSPRIIRVWLDRIEQEDVHADTFRAMYRSILDYINGEVNGQLALEVMDRLHTAAYNAWARNPAGGFAQEIANENRTFYSEFAGRLNSEVFGLEILGRLYNLEASTTYGAGIERAARNVTTVVSRLYGNDRIRIVAYDAATAVMPFNGHELLEIGGKH